MIELFPNGLKGSRNFSVVHHPSELRIAVAGDDDLGFEAVAMQAPAFVGFWQMRQQMSRFKLKCFP